MCEGYENKKHAEQELMRQQTYILVSPYMDKASSYERFKRRWRFAWEKEEQVVFEPLTAEQVETIKANHQKYLDKAKKR